MSEAIEQTESQGLPIDKSPDSELQESNKADVVSNDVNVPADDNSPAEVAQHSNGSHISEDENISNKANGAHKGEEDEKSSLEKKIERQDMLEAIDQSSQIQVSSEDASAKNDPSERGLNGNTEGQLLENNRDGGKNDFNEVNSNNIGDETSANAVDRGENNIDENNDDDDDDEEASVIDSRLGNLSTDHTSLNVETHQRTLSTFSVSSSVSVNKNVVFIKSALGLINESREAKKNAALQNATKRALEALKNNEFPDSSVMFEPLKLACQTESVDLKVASLDCLSKLITFSIFNQPEADIPTYPNSIVTPPPKVPLIDSAVETIANCFDGEGTDPKVELQVIRALMACVLNMPVHGASLLRAVRQIYNVFIFSLSPINQGIAQASLTQVINTIFERVGKVHLSKKSAYLKTTSSQNIPEKFDYSDEQDVGIKIEPTEKLTLQNLENISDVDEARAADANKVLGDEDDLVIKDVFLIFRAMCKLSIKSLESDSLDMRSHSVRSKLLSLHILHSIIKDHIEIFLSKDAIITSSTQEETRLIDAVRQYLCLSLSRNAASPIAPVFEISLEIFWLLISNLRSEFKREIPVFFDEIYFPITEMKTSTAHQKRYLLSIIQRLCNDSRCIIEFYLNYDCDSGMPNICERLINYLTKLASSRIDATPLQKQNFRDNLTKPLAVYNLSQISSLSITNLSSKPPEPDATLPFPLDYALKMVSINSTVAFLRSLFSWAQKGISSLPVIENDAMSSMSRKRSSTVGSNGAGSPNASFFNDNPSKFNLDDPSQFETLKQRKKVLLEGIRQFNLKPQKGIESLINSGFIASDSPSDIGLFLLNLDGLDKSLLGEFLGEGDERNIAIMHAFVDGMEFSSTLFVEAMRRFLQTFRLPGESQKIDRFMLKFAERYVLGNPNVFANADTAYVLAYSVIMLNTDLHSPQIKNRMTLDGFIRNNAGIDDGKDLPVEFLGQIYTEIQENEIKLQSEQHAALIAGDLNPVHNGFFGGKDATREAYMQASKEMSTKTEKLVRTLGKRLRSDEGTRSIFYAASHIHHVKTIFDTLWMSILAGLTPPFKDYDEKDTTDSCLEGIKLAIRIACMFDLEYARTSFVGALVQFEYLSNYEEMKSKNIDAIYVMLELAATEGNSLKSAWKHILTSISQIERLQLIAQGVDSDAIPDVSIARLANRNSFDSSRSASNSGFFRSFTYGSNNTSLQVAHKHFHNQHLTPEVANLITSTELDVAIDRVFTNSAELSGQSIVEFVKALSEVSAEEIESSGQSTNPRMFSLQKVVDVCYYNMNRIRVEWSHLWSIMGTTFNNVGCHSNPVVVFFALDSLRQLSMRFLEIEELFHFKFQKEFLKPFEYIITNNRSFEIKDMILECINNMILAKADKIKSGWKTIFGVLTVAGKCNSEALVYKSYKLANQINNDYFDVVYSQESFSDLVLCFTELSKNHKFQRINLLSLDILHKLIRKIASMSFEKKSLENSEIKNQNDKLIKLWFPVLFGLHDIIKTGDDLEVRSRALNYMFDDLTEYGTHFDNEFWDLICHELLFPLFDILSSHWEINQNDNDDDVSVWLSTTLIQALRNMIQLFTSYFESLSRILEGYLNLLVSCICQENDTIARIGRSCLQDLLIQNCSKFNDHHWEQVSSAFFNLFDYTTAKELFKADPLNMLDSQLSNNHSSQEDDVSNVSKEPPKSPKSPKRISPEVRLQRSKDKSAIVVKCVLQLLMIETLSELFESDPFYENIPYDYLIKLSNLLNSSYKFAREFNDDLNLRVRLFNAGVMETVPTLLKQESSASAVYIGIMFKIYCDEDKSSEEQKKDIINQLVPLCNTIIERYVSLDPNSKQRNISTWRPVIVEILQGYIELEENDFMDNCPVMFDLVLRLFDRGISTELRNTIKTFLARVGDTYINDRKD